MEEKNIKFTQVTFYLFVIELILVMVRFDDKAIVDFRIMKWILLITIILFISSIIYFLVKRQNKRAN